MTRLVFHRGCNLNAPENSVAGIRECVELAPEFPVEIDLVVTRDLQPVLLHDLSLDRLFGVRRTVFDLTLDELRRVAGRAEIVTLKEVLEIFPETEFVLDLRDDTSSALFPGSTLSAEDLREGHATSLVEAIAPIVRRESASRLRLVAGTLETYRTLKQLFPEFPASLAERSSRAFLEDLLLDPGAAPPVRATDLVYVRFLAASRDLTERLHARGLSVCVTASFPFRGLENSGRVVERAIASGADHVLVSPVDKSILSRLANSALMSCEGG